MCCVGCHWWAAAPPADSLCCGASDRLNGSNRGCFVLQNGRSWPVDGIHYVKFSAVNLRTPFCRVAKAAGGSVALALSHRLLNRHDPSVILLRV
jgi:hypothetical protein